MHLSAVVIENFRSYGERTRIPVDQITGFVGRNDAGKSTVLEALEIFFNSSLVKMEPEDCCVHSDSETVRIGCVFSELPATVLIDAKVPTSLADEYLLNADGELEIHKLFDCSKKKPTESILAVAEHPSDEGFSDLLTLAIADLKKRAADHSVDTSGVDKRISSELRQAIWKSASALTCVTTEIDLAKADAKKIWTTLSGQLPVFALFQSDRSSKDQDPEVQSPLKEAVREALKAVEDQLAQIKEHVRSQTIEVAERTIEKLREMDPELATTLAPDFQSEPKWDTLFKLSLTGPDDIPINKRGSGVRRLILLNFFRAQAEKRRKQEGAPSVIYAIEEPETSQHPDNQRMLIEALLELSQADGVQVILTTHVPALAGLLPTESLRFIHHDGGKKQVEHGDDDVVRRVAETLGVYPDPRSEFEVVVYVEGPNDIAYLEHVSLIMNGENPAVPRLGRDPKVIVIPTGGSTLKQWVEKHYLRGLGRPEVHLYDRDDRENPKYGDAVNAVNNRDGNSFAKLTDRRELENYLDAASVIETYADHNIEIELEEFDAWDDVPEIVAKAVHERTGETPWADLDEETVRKKVSRAKRQLNDGAASKLTCDRLRAIGCFDELHDWFLEIAKRIGR